MSVSRIRIEFAQVGMRESAHKPGLTKHQRHAVLASLEQYTVVVWAVMIWAVIAAGTCYNFKAPNSNSVLEKFE